MVTAHINLSFRAGGAPEGQSAAKNPRLKPSNAHVAGFSLCAVAILFALTTCGPSKESADIVIGEYGSLTGSEATFGQSTHNGIALAVDEINAAGGIAGRKIRVITEDDQSKAEEAANAVTKLISSNDVAAILGEVASSNSLAAAPICQQNKVPMITPSSTYPDVTKKGNYIFRMCF